MSGSEHDRAKAGPVLGETITELQGCFPSDAALQEAITRLQQTGVDRSEISVPDAHPHPVHATPEQSADNPNTAEDAQQSRTLHGSLAGAVGALAAAGAVIATGGAAAPAVAAAVAGGALLGGAAYRLTEAGEKAQHDLREEAAARGELLLSVHLRDPSRREFVERIMREAGASEVQAVVRTSGAVASSGKHR